MCATITLRDKKHQIPAHLYFNHFSKGPPQNDLYACISHLNNGLENVMSKNIILT